MSKRILLVVVMSVTTALGCRADDIGADGWADIVQTELARGNPLPRLSELLPSMTVEEAYAVQRALVDSERPRRAIGGYKAGFTVPGSGQRFGIDGPVWAVLFADGARGDSARIGLGDYRRLMVEIELGFVLRSPIRRPMKSVEDLRTYVRDVVPAVELPDLAYAEPARLTAVDIIATNMASAAYVVGKPLRLASPDAVNGIVVTLYRDDVSIDQGRADRAMGDQWQALLWLVNRAQAAGLPLEGGQVLITGLLGRLQAGEAGHYRADYGAAGGLSFELVATPVQAPAR